MILILANHCLIYTDNTEKYAIHWGYLANRNIFRNFEQKKDYEIANKELHPDFVDCSKFFFRAIHFNHSRE